MFSKRSYLLSTSGLNLLAYTSTYFIFWKCTYQVNLWFLK
jgi:hypothetical protein